VDSSAPRSVGRSIDPPARRIRRIYIAYPLLVHLSTRTATRDTMLISQTLSKALSFRQSVRSAR
jgi:hypothetical protein